MRMEVQFENGRRAEAVLLAANRYEMRVAVTGSADTEQWQKHDGAWFDENGGRIEIEALTAVEGTDWVTFCGELAAQSMALRA